MRAPDPGAGAALAAPDLLTDLSIRDGHRRLLDAFREFDTAAEGTAGAEPDVDELRATVAFLRQSVLPFARWEETCLPPAAELTEELAFEHAFLAAEIDALAAAVAALAEQPWSHPERRATAARVRRALHRIEAVLELHVLKGEDRVLLARETPAAGAPPLLPAAASRAAAAPWTMTPGQIRHFLAQHDWGILATSDEGAPYAVPVAYGWDGQRIYLACAAGRKLANLEREPAACLTVVEVKDGTSWRSAVARGRIHWLDSLADRLGAARAIHRQRAGNAPFSPSDLGRFARARFARLDPYELSGRGRG